MSTFSALRCLVLIVALCLCARCITPQVVISDEVDKAIIDSFSFRRAYAISPSRTRWFVDGRDGKYPIIYVGHDMGTHYTRSATLRVREHCTIERQEVQGDGELSWIPDR